MFTYMFDTDRHFSLALYVITNRTRIVTCPHYSIFGCTARILTSAIHCEAHQPSSIEEMESDPFTISGWGPRVYGSLMPSVELWTVIRMIYESYCREETINTYNECWAAIWFAVKHNGPHKTIVFHPLRYKTKGWRRHERINCLIDWVQFTSHHTLHIWHADQLTPRFLQEFVFALILIRWPHCCARKMSLAGSHRSFCQSLQLRSFCSQT